MSVSGAGGGLGGAGQEGAEDFPVIGGNLGGQGLDGRVVAGEPGWSAFGGVRGQFQEHGAAVGWMGAATDPSGAFKPVGEHGDGP